MSFNFELILFYAIVVTGLIALFDTLFFASKRKENDAPMNVVVDFSRSVFPVLLLVFILRSFLFEPFRIPSSSLSPTLLKGDFILVNKYDYGIRLPVVHKKLWEISEPQRGDIVVFRYPANPSVDFIKRVVGVPGDKISYINKTIYINGKPLPQAVVGSQSAETDEGQQWQAQIREEDVLGKKHQIYINPKSPNQDVTDIVVPPKMYFVMGDNRDFSNDSRFWGFVPEKNIVGKGVMVWMSWAGLDNGIIRWKRIGERF